MPLRVEGWDEALHEIGRLSFAMVLSPQDVAALLKSVEDVPALVVAGAEDVLVPLKSTQTLASKLVNSVSLLPFKSTQVYRLEFTQIWYAVEIE